MTKIQESLYKDIVKSIPLLCIDLVIDCYKNRNQKGYLLVKRCQEPLMGEWWVPGGRVYQGEDIFVSAKRKLEEETGLKKKEKEMTLMGIYQDIFECSSFGKHAYHTVSIVFNLNVDIQKEEIRLDNTSKEWIISDKLPDRLLNKFITF